MPEGAALSWSFSDIVIRRKGRLAFRYRVPGCSLLDQWPEAAHPGHCRTLRRRSLDEPTAGAQPWPRERVLMPLNGPCPNAIGRSVRDRKLSFKQPASVSPGLGVCRRVANLLRDIECRDRPTKTL
jgi:hypothetical protein